jgi:hypothetical protein
MYSWLFFLAFALMGLSFKVSFKSLPIMQFEIPTIQIVRLI